MAIRNEPDNYLCGDCIRVKNWGKRNCKKCSYYYTKEHKSIREQYSKEKRKERRLARKNSPPELVEAYTFLRDKIFPPGYLLPAEKITFKWGRKGSGGGTCWKHSKVIRIGDCYRGYNNLLSLYALMIHEALHLRMPHHRKSFKRKEKELQAKLREMLEKDNNSYVGELDEDNKGLKKIFKEDDRESVQNPPEMQYNNIVESKQEDDKNE